MIGAPGGRGVVGAAWQSGHERFSRQRESESCMRLLGRLMEMLGLALPLLAIVLQLAQRITVGQMLIMLVAALSMFYLGRMIQGYSR